MNQMPVPGWAEDLKHVSSQLHEEMDFTNKDFSFGGGLKVCTDFSTFFARFQMQEDLQVAGAQNLLVQLFPRAGEEDEYYDGHYIPRCKNCRSEVQKVETGTFAACPRCGHHGLVFVEGRLEAKRDTIVFPENMDELIRSACSNVWMGDVVGPEHIEELGAYVFMFKWVNENATSGVLEKFLEQVDQALDN